MGTQTQYTPHQHLGVIKDLAPEAVPAEFWTTVTNASFPDLASERTPGWSEYAASPPAGSDVIYGGSVDNVLSGQNQWVYMTTDKVYVTDGSDHFDITPAAGLIACDPGDWTLTKLGGIPVFNNPNNPPMYWALDTGAPAEVLPGWPINSTCKAMRAVKYHLVALNITEDGVQYPNQVWWSNGAQSGAIPSEWIPTAQNDAGDSILGDSPGEIVDAAPLRDQLVIYKNSSTYTMQYVAGQYVYAFRKIFPNVGMQTRNCAAEIENKHVVFTGEDVIMHDGQNFQSMVNDKVQRVLVDSIDKTQLQLCNVVARVVDQQAWICIPISGEQYLSYAFIININNGLIGAITLPNVAAVTRGTIDPAGVAAQTTWDTSTQNWDDASNIWTQSPFSPTNDSVMMFQPTTEQLLAVGLGSSADGAPITSTLERLSMRVGEGIYHSVITQIALQMEGETGDVVKIRMGQQAYFDQPISWLPAQDFVIGQTRAISQIIDGRYLSIRFDITTTNEWRMHKYFLKMKQAGEY